jgi:hypothetical protein
MVAACVANDDELDVIWFVLVDPFFAPHFY